MVARKGVVLASWSSKGGRWTAELIKNTQGYRLAEKKHGSECGAAWRPMSSFAKESAAIEWASGQVKSGFDVPMKRTM